MSERVLRITRGVLWTTLALTVAWLIDLYFFQEPEVSPAIAALVAEHEKEGADHFRRMEWEPAAEEFEAAVHLDPRSLPAWLNLGFCQIEEGAHDDAFRSLCTAISLDTNVHVAYRGLGMLAVEAGAPALAPMFLETASDLLDASTDPQIRSIAADEKAQILRWMAEALLALGQPQEALEKAQQAYALRPKEKTVVFTLSRVQHGAGHTRDAIATMQECIGLDRFFFARAPRRDWKTGHLESYYLYLARMEIEVEDYAGALGALTTALEASRGPSLEEALRLTALCYEKTGDLEQARRYAHQASVEASSGEGAPPQGAGSPVESPEPGPAARGQTPGMTSPAAVVARPPSSPTPPAPRSPPRASSMASPVPGSPGAGETPTWGESPSGRASPTAFAPARPAIRLADRTAAAGLSGWSHDCGPTLIYNPEATGPGVAVMDFDGDGWMDIFVPTGAQAGADGTMHRTNTNVLWRNNGDGTFTDVTARAGLSGAGFGQGCVVADYDNDGCPDLVVTCYGQSQLFHNNGDGTFTETAARAGIVGGRFATGAAFGDYDRDGWLDLFVGHYTEHDYANPPPHARLLTVEGDYVSPESLGPFVGEGEENHLFHNRGDGTFEERTEAAHVAKGTRKSKTLGVVWTDLSGGGWPDLLVGNDESPLFLYQNNHDGTFREIASQRWIADGRGNMGIDIADIDGDGILDMVITHWVHEETALYRGTREHRFVDQALVAGLGKQNPVTTGWGVTLADFANAGRLDLLIANGLTSASHYDPVRFASQKNLYEPQAIELYRNAGGLRFEDESAASGVAALPPRAGRGVAALDVDNDGGLDVVVANNNAPVYLLANATPGRGHWLELELEGTRSNRDAVGAKVRLTAGNTAQLRETHAGISYLSSASPLVHFGLGASTVADRIDVDWPSGAHTSLGRVPVDRILRVVEPPAPLEGRRR